jgi:hypothetical protein
MICPYTISPIKGTPMAIESQTILCVDCEKRKKELEENGIFEVIDCKPDPAPENPPGERRRCIIRMKLKGDTTTAG